MLLDLLFLFAFLGVAAGLFVSHLADLRTR